MIKVKIDADIDPTCFRRNSSPDLFGNSTNICTHKALLAHSGRNDACDDNKRPTFPIMNSQTIEILPHEQKARGLPPTVTLDTDHHHREYYRILSSLNTSIYMRNLHRILTC